MRDITLSIQRMKPAVPSRVGGRGKAKRGPKETTEGTLGSTTWFGGKLLTNGGERFAAGFLFRRNRL